MFLNASLWNVLFFDVTSDPIETQTQTQSRASRICCGRCRPRVSLTLPIPGYVMPISYRFVTLIWMAILLFFALFCSPTISPCCKLSKMKCHTSLPLYVYRIPHCCVRISFSERTAHALQSARAAGSQYRMEIIHIHHVVSLLSIAIGENT